MCSYRRRCTSAEPSTAYKKEQDDDKNFNEHDEEIAKYLIDDTAFVEQVVQNDVQAVLEADMTEHLNVSKSEQTTDRVAHHSGYYSLKLWMSVGTIDLRVSQSRDHKFNTQVFDRYRCSENAFVSTLVAMCVHGTSKLKLSKIAEQLCGHCVSASTISVMVVILDEELAAVAPRRLDEVEYHYMMLSS